MVGLGSGGAGGFSQGMEADMTIRTDGDGGDGRRTGTGAQHVAHASCREFASLYGRPIDGNACEVDRDRCLRIGTPLKSFRSSTNAQTRATLEPTLGYLHILLLLNRPLSELSPVSNIDEQRDQKRPGPSQPRRDILLVSDPLSHPYIHPSRSEWSSVV